MSKKFIYIRIIIIFICLLFFALFICLIKNIYKSTSIKDNIIEETAEDRVVFDMTLAPNKQKNLKGHVKEYMSQVYDYLYKDVKWKNIKNPYPYSYSELKEKKDLNNFYNVLKMTTLPRLVNILFDFNNVKRFDDVYIDYPLNMDDLPVTENYKKKHPKPLYEEFDFIKKEDYKHPKTYHNEYMDFDYWYEFNYVYHVGVDDNNKVIGVGEDKHVALLFIDEETNTEHSGIVRDKEGNESPSYIETRVFYFNYMTDENGYIDDIVYDRTETINDDKYLDNMIKYE